MRKYDILPLGEMPEGNFAPVWLVGKCPNRDFGDFALWANARRAIF